MTCSCGEDRDHEIAHRDLASGERIYFWSDGCVTWGDTGRTMLKGIGRGRSAYSRRVALRANEYLRELVYRIERKDIVTAIKTAREFILRGGTYDDFERRIRDVIFEAIEP